MPKKRTSPESSDDEPTNQGSDSVVQEDENSKRAKLVSLNDTTLQDLPIELIERILIKVIVMEVQDMKLVKSERKGKANPVIDRLRTVCSQWDSILTTNFFRNELNRTFDAQKTIRLKILHQSRLGFNVAGLTTLRDEIFVLSAQSFITSTDATIDVYDCNNIAAAKDVITVPDMWPTNIESCSVSNCVYILHRIHTTRRIRILRITKDDENHFNIALLITIGPWMRYNYTLSVAADGRLIVSGHERCKLPAIRIYNTDGSMQREMIMQTDIPEFSRIIPRPNGNLVLVSTDYYGKTTLTEIDMDAKIIRQYQTSSLGAVSVCNATFGRMMLIDHKMKIELLDSELNLLEVTDPQLTAEKFLHCPYISHFNSDRNELVTVLFDPEHFDLSFLTIFHSKEE